jgi:plastocyanin
MSSWLRKGVLLTLLMLAGCGTNSGGTNAVGPAAAKEPEIAPNQITIDNFTFNPSTLTVSAGAKVTWVNRDDVPHTATGTAKPRLFDSGALDTDDQFTHVFPAPGTYEYFCAVHPQMTGRVIVK